ncbi:MAG TPA: BON domain-containing protein [Polyangiaceae bacterium]
MADQNRPGFRRDNDDDDRRWQRRDEEDDWRREDRGQRGFGRDEGYGRGSRSYGASSESERGGPSGDYGRNRGYGSGGRPGFGQDYGQRYGGEGGYSGEQGFGSQRSGSEAQGYGGQRYGSEAQGYGGQRSGGGQQGRFGGDDYESQRHAGVGHSGLSGQDYGNQRYGAEESYGSLRYGSQGSGSYGGYGGQDYGSQTRGGQQGRLGYGTPQYGAFGATPGGRQWREWQGGGSSQQAGGWPRGEHRGKGPKGYTRSDERIREDVCDCLSDDDELDASDITVTVKGGEVTLEGTVPDRRAKQRAEDLAEGVSGVRDVDNKLRKNKGMLQEMSDRLTGGQNNERGGHAGSGTRNGPPNASMSR